jgi:cytochrome o ubiquinol oxidase subunit 2
MIYTMNGMVSQLHLQADQPGTYYGQSAQFSGDGFSDMNFVTRAVPAGDFNNWVAQATAQKRVLDRAAYTELSKQSVVRQPIAFGRVEPHLFDDIATQKIAPQAGPQEGRAGAHVSPRTAG